METEHNTDKRRSRSSSDNLLHWSAQQSLGTEKAGPTPRHPQAALSVCFFTLSRHNSFL